MDEETIVIDPDYLEPEKRHLAYWLSALARLEELRQKRENGVNISQTKLDRAREEVNRYKLQRKEMMLPVRDVAERSGLGTSTVRMLAAGRHRLSNQVRSERRGNLWYLVPSDVVSLVEAGMIVPREQ